MYIDGKRMVRGKQRRAVESIKNRSTAGGRVSRRNFLVGSIPAALLAALAGLVLSGCGGGGDDGGGFIKTAQAQTAPVVERCTMIDFCRHPGKCLPGDPGHCEREGTPLRAASAQADNVAATLHRCHRAPVWLSPR